MKTFTQQQIIDAYDRLPDPVKDAIFEEATADKIQAVGKKHGLLLDRMGNLAEEVGYVMLGLIPAKEFPEYVMQTCGVSAQKAGEIVTDLNQAVFLPIQDHIFSAVKEPKPAEKVVATPRAFDADPSPAFRPSSFAMPMQGSEQKSSKGQPSVAPMIFPQKLHEEQSSPTAMTQNQPSIAPKAPEFREIAKDTKKSSTTDIPKAGDVYREPIL
ncbi:MAG: hypothetical protein AAB417_01885 [Patescibacteria group bacterium]